MGEPIMINISKESVLMSWTATQVPLSSSLDPASKIIPATTATPAKEIPTVESDLINVPINLGVLR
jgi:hypothetical protein